jgi:DNA-binding FrmR family transcriptional regulator
MDLKDQYRLRVQNCIGTILDVQRTINKRYAYGDLLTQFQSLKEALEDLDLALVSEKEIKMVEQATNALLREFKLIFKTGKLGPVYKHQMN